MSENETEAPRFRRRSGRAYAVSVIVATLVIAVLGQWLYARAMSAAPVAPLADAPVEVTAIEAVRAEYRPVARYVGEIEPWLEASIGPQLTSAYVTEVRVRPGDVVTHGDVVATLDCRESRASAAATRDEALAVAAQERALARQAERTSALLDAGFVAANEVDLRAASSEERLHTHAAREAQASRSSLFVGDCTLRAPFDAEIETRDVDPGAFVGPGTVVLRVVDRSRVRVIADIPETALAEVAPGREVDLHVIASDTTLHTTVTRRAPAADPVSRTVRIEIDVPNDDRAMPVRTTAEILVTASRGVDAIALPLVAATIVGARARVWIVDEGIARRRTLRVVGESGARVYVRPEIAPGTILVVEGREALDEGMRVHLGRMLEAAAPAGDPP
jgi:RND family efflux transporter MFP subunit